MPVESLIWPPEIVEGTVVWVMPSMMFSTSCTVFVEPAPMPTVTAVVPMPVIVV